MNKQIEALKMAIEFIERHVEADEYDWLIQACKKALAEAENPEPVAWMEEYQSCKVNGDERLCHSDKVFRLVQLLASQSKEWQSLSDDNILKLFKPKFECEIEDFELIDFARAIEQALKELNAKK